MTKFRLLLSGAMALSAISGTPLRAETFTWNRTAGGTYDWNAPVNWTPATRFPSEPGDVANLNIDIAGNQTIRLGEDITIGVLQIGDDKTSGANFTTTITNGSGAFFELIFDSRDFEGPALLNVSAGGTPVNAINVPVSLVSDLQISLANTAPVGGVNTNSQRLTFGEEFLLGSQTVTVTGGYVGAGDVNQVTFGAGADIFGSGRIVNNGETPIIISNPLDSPKSFTGIVELNGRGIGGSNTGSLTLTSGSLVDAEEFIINGFLSAGATQNGGSVHSGDSSTATFGGQNPGQRLTFNTITLNGGSLTAAGQAMNAANATTLVEDTVDLVQFNSAYSLLTVVANNLSGGTRLDVTTLVRLPGASAFVRSGSLGGTARLLVDNADEFLIGAAGDEGTTTMSIIPWMLAANGNASAGSGDTFATSTLNGVRGLSTAAGVEYSSAITAGADHNVSTSTVTVSALASSATINSLRFSAGGASSIGLGKTLILGSGGLIFTNNNGAIGTSGLPTAGTLQLGEDAAPAEGVVWANGTNTNTIAASITGDLGLSKAGTGTLILTGSNSYSGDTYVGGGTLQVGTGIFSSNLGPEGDVTVATGAVLSLMNGGAIPDDATLTLEQFGLFNGRMNLGAGVDERIGSLFFGNDFQGFGTWGSTASAALFKNDTYFSGSGILTVVPEPRSGMMLLLAAATLLGRRRRITEALGQQ